MNVIMTRPKALLIIIGNDNTLKYNGNWLEVINKCISHKNFRVAIVREEITEPSECLASDGDLEIIGWSNIFKYRLSQLQ